MTTALAVMHLDDMERLANAIAKSGLFGMKTPEAALALMAIAQAEGQPPALAARDYHVVQGRPVLKADAMLARFQGAGGKMRMVVYTDEKVEAEFSHPAGGTVSISWDLERAKRAGLGGKDNWKSYPRQMLRARVISEGVRTVFPGAVVGMLTPEEAVDLPAEAPEKDVTPAAVAKPASGIAALQARVAELAPKPVVDGELIEARGSGVTLESVLSAIEKSQDRDQLDVAVDLAGDLSDGNKAIARDAFVKKRAALKATSDAAA